MMNEYRVDRADSKKVPCGMNSIIYTGRSIGHALRAFSAAAVGVDSWGKPNPAYGVILSKWDSARRDYVTQAQRGVVQT